MTSLLTLPFSLILLVFALGTIGESWFAPLGIMPAAISVCGLWLAVKLFAVAGFPGKPMQSANPSRQAEDTHVQP